MKTLLYRTYPKSCKTDDRVLTVVSCFKRVYAVIDSSKFNKRSNAVLSAVAPGLMAAGFDVETGKKSAEKISIPVLFGLNGLVEKSFDVDAASKDKKVVVEVEAGRAVDNHQFLKDLFEACAMPVTEHLVIAVRNEYRGADDFQKVCDFMEALFASARFVIPLTSVTIVGY